MTDEEIRAMSLEVLDQLFLSYQEQKITLVSIKTEIFEHMNKMGAELTRMRSKVQELEGENNRLRICKSELMIRLNGYNQHLNELIKCWKSYEDWKEIDCHD